MRRICREENTLTRFEDINVNDNNVHLPWEEVVNNSWKYENYVTGVQNMFFYPQVTMKSDRIRYVTLQ